MIVDLQLRRLHVLWNFAVNGFARPWSCLKRCRIDLIRCPPRTAQTNFTSGYAYSANRGNAALVSESHVNISPLTRLV